MKGESAGVVEMEKLLVYNSFCRTASGLKFGMTMLVPDLRETKKSEEKSKGSIAS